MSLLTVMAMLTANQQPAPHAFSIIFCIIKRNLNEMYRHRPVLETSVPLKFQTIFLASDRNSQFLAGSLSHFLFLVNVDDFFTPADEYRFDFSSSTEPKFVMDVIGMNEVFCPLDLLFLVCSQQIPRKSI